MTRPCDEEEREALAEMRAQYERNELGRPRKMPGFCDHSWCYFRLCYSLRPDPRGWPSPPFVAICADCGERLEPGAVAHACAAKHIKEGGRT